MLFLLSPPPAAGQAGKASATFNADINVLGHHKGSSVDGIDADVADTVAATATRDAGVGRLRRT